ncbi:MBL fold metallo-hydrolase, partial [Herbaspirillum sp. 3C11]|uniref:MBL fold metallo-hydrolase n=1 Tax=Herbaspirillum sp. 3C11 TaxID=2559615 RepID=UPI001FD80CD6
MRVEILGCSGGIGGNTLRTTSLLADRDILIDAGTGVNDLPLDALAAIDHVFITHSHLDHIACLPFILDSVGDQRNTPLTMHATQATQDIIRKHIDPDLFDVFVRSKVYQQYADKFMPASQIDVVDHSKIPGFVP